MVWGGVGGLNPNLVSALAPFVLVQVGAAIGAELDNLLNNYGVCHSSCEFLPPPVGPQSGVWVWQLGQFSDCRPGYCARCQSWGGLTWVKLG